MPLSIRQWRIKAVSKLDHQVFAGHYDCGDVSRVCHDLSPVMRPVTQYKPHLSVVTQTVDNKLAAGWVT